MNGPNLAITRVICPPGAVMVTFQPLSFCSDCIIGQYRQYLHLDYNYQGQKDADLILEMDWMRGIHSYFTFVSRKQSKPPF